MLAIAANQMAVFGNVAQHRKNRERANQRNGLVLGQFLKPRLQFGACCIVIKAPILHRQLSHFFNGRKHGQALLLGDDFTQQGAQQANVVTQLGIFVVDHKPSSDHNAPARKAMAVADEGP